MMIFGREPAMILAAINAVIALAISFGLDLTDDQVGQIVALVAIVLGIITRSVVSPVGKDTPTASDA